MPFFQQVLSIAPEEHLISVSDYSLEHFFNAALSQTDQLQLEQLLERIEVWETNRDDRQSAEKISSELSISLADAIDHVIFEQLCPDWILVAQEGRSLPNAESIKSFLQEWGAIRDDLPPSDEGDGGGSVRLPSGGGNGGGGNGGGNAKDGSKRDGGYPSQSPAYAIVASNSYVLFTQNAYVNSSWGLSSFTNPKFTQNKADWIKAEGNSVPSSVEMPMQELLAQANAGQPLPVGVRLIPSGNGWNVVFEMTHLSRSDAAKLAQLGRDRFVINGGLTPHQTAKLPLRQDAKAALSQAVQQAQNQATVNNADNPNNSSNGLIASAALPVAKPVNNNAAIVTESTKSVDQPIVSGPTIVIKDLPRPEAEPTVIENLTRLNPPSLLIDSTKGKAGAQPTFIASANLPTQVMIDENPVIGSNPMPIAKPRPDDSDSMPGQTSIAISMPLPIPTPKPPKFTIIGDGRVTVISGGKSPILDLSLGNANVVTGGKDNITSPTNQGSWIIEDDGDDQVNAGNENNFIAAGLGNNRISSGTGVDLFVLSAGPGVTKIVNYQSHDCFGLIGGLAYEDLEILPWESRNSGKSNSSGNRGVMIRIRPNVLKQPGDQLAIVIGAQPSQLTKESFYQVVYEPNRGNTLPTGDWLSVGQRSGPQLTVPLRPNPATPNPTILNPMPKFRDGAA
jgi:hypothetical protein